MTTDRSVGNTVHEMKDTKQRIMESYLVKGTETGFDNVTLSMVADMTGISKATIFSHFRNTEELKKEAISYCTSSIKPESFTVNFRTKDIQNLFVELLNSINDTFTAFPLNAYISYLEQKKLTDTQAGELDDKLNSMLCARILVALDYAVQRSWLSMRDTDSCARIMTSYVRRALFSEDWETILFFLKDLT